MENIMMIDAGRFGFVILKYYAPPSGFEDMETFTDSKELFEALWQEWFETKLYLMAEGTELLEENGYEGVFQSLSKEEQTILTGRKLDFALKAGICL